MQTYLKLFVNILDLILTFYILYLSTILPATSHFPFTGYCHKSAVLTLGLLEIVGCQLGLPLSWTVRESVHLLRGNQVDL